MQGMKWLFERCVLGFCQGNVVILSPGLSFSSGNDNVKAGLNALFTYWNIFSRHKQQMWCVVCEYTEMGQLNSLFTGSLRKKNYTHLVFYSRTCVQRISSLL